ncbi:hypothetical protein FOPG_04954 [Fusarium oxysporum f. sp. conglutinans race 2 54008]|uniref:Uncharacterized protein n=2 Tax=Fusarium oxysporum TaxID=5507 RepID=X0NJC9_FUSOX|nr:hypothetical protein FOPG_04954 [Fusarium oxysporum f. sp. conglutinans race 2 54008]EXM32705.1 hypothetical protein FOTG_02950 [Fusarium oxysporum f. sp. vasinfectum 25433]
MAESESDADADPNAKLTSGPRRVELRSRAGSGSGGRRIRQTDKIRHDQSSQVETGQERQHEDEGRNMHSSLVTVAAISNLYTGTEDRGQRTEDKDR